jgi:signal transduction histidine kinase/AraC-like DNA-binding protein
MGQDFASRDDNTDAFEYQQDSLGPLLTISISGWLLLLVGLLVYREVTGQSWFVLPLLATLPLLLLAALLRRRGALAAAGWALVAALFSGPLLTLLYGRSPVALSLLVLPILAASVLLPPGAIGLVTALALGVLLVGAFLPLPPSAAGLLENLFLLALPACLCLLVATVLTMHALGIKALVEWAMDSQRKDARRAELFRRQQEQLQLAMRESERANARLQIVNVQLGEARRIAEVANQLKTRLLANVSHELRTPLQVILGLSEAGSATATPDLARIHRSGKHLNRLIDDLLDLSRAEINALELYPETLDVQRLASDVFQSLAPAPESATGVVWRNELPPRLPLIQADGVRLRQILFNLLGNAAKFTRQGSISLGAVAEPPYLHLWVADTGVGIPVEQQAQIFEPFVSGQSGERPAGVGLGLSITRHLVQLHQGLLTLESQPGVGSTFHIYIPLPNVQGQPASLPAGGTPCLLLLAAQPGAEALAMAERQNLPLRRVASLSELVALLQREQPAGIIWDLAHATAEDWPMLAHLRSQPQLACLPLLLFAQADQALPDLGSGLTEVLIKPLGAAELAQRMQNLRSPAANGPLLIVDDDAQARAAYLALLQPLFPQQRLLEAANGAEALAILEQEHPALIMLDLMMPGIDGFAVLEAIRANPATQTIPVLVLSGRVLSLADVERLHYAHVTFQSKNILAAEEIAALVERRLENSAELNPATSALVKEALAYIHQHYQQSFSRQEIASFVGVSERYLTEIFHQEVGLPLWEYLNRFRIGQARQLLRSTNQSIGEIAAEVGMENAHYFTRIFRRLTGTSPSAYRNQP